MFQALRKAVSGNYAKDPRNSLVQDEYRKKKLKDNLALHIKRLQKAHIHESQLIERNDVDAVNICQALEAIFLHEYQMQVNTIPTNINLRIMFSEGIGREDEMISMAFWGLLKEVTHNDVITELKHLVVTTEVGLCRAWIRLAINDCLIVSYLDAILSSKSLLRHFYGVNAFLMDTELPFIMKELLQGIIQFEFQLNYNSSKLNTWEKRTLQLAGILELSEHKEKDHLDNSSNRNIRQSIKGRDRSSSSIEVGGDIPPDINIAKGNPTRSGSNLNYKRPSAKSVEANMGENRDVIVASILRPEYRNDNAKKIKSTGIDEIIPSVQPDSQRERDEVNKDPARKTESMEDKTDFENTKKTVSRSEEKNFIQNVSTDDCGNTLNTAASNLTLKKEFLNENFFIDAENKCDMLQLPIYDNEGIISDKQKSLSMEFDLDEAILQKTPTNSALVFGNTEENNSSAFLKKITEIPESSVEDIEKEINGNSETSYESNEKESMDDCAWSGNRLSGTGWSGWSSAFDNPEDNCDIYDSDSPVSDELNESFGSLLQIYGTNQSPKYFISPEFTRNDYFEGIPKEIGNTAIDEKSHSTQTDHLTSTPHSDAQLVHMNFEVVPMTAPLQGRHVDKKTLSSLSQLTELALEQGLDEQNFSCKHCGVLIGLIYGPYRICNFDGSYYCYDCHDEEEHIIPARVIQDWDFRRYQVSKYNKVFLMKIEEEPLFHIDEINSLLYDVVPDLKELKHLRIQLQHIKEYVQTCRQEIAEEFRRRLWPREYLCDDIHQYSLLDLLQVFNNQLAHHLKKVITEFSKHIYKCVLCCQKGFICEYCHDDTIIYPFQMNIAVQCQTCLATFHKSCRQDKRCPKCVRIRLRSQSKGMTDIETDRLLLVTQKERFTNNDIL